MRNTLTALISAASFCALATAASAQTIPDNTGAPANSYRYTAPQPGAFGHCEIISGNHVCFSGSMNAGYGYGYGGPVGAVIAAPVAVVEAPFNAFGSGPAYPPGYGATYAPATGAPMYSYESQVRPQPGSCNIISGNRVCTMP
jgi:hypothetical protein